MLRGAAAGAAGTTALNTVGYLDMVVRARAASSTPEHTVERLSERTHLHVPGEGEDRDNRVAGLGALSGIAVGVGIGALLGLMRSAGRRPSAIGGGLTAAVGALIGTNGPMMLLGVTDPGKWAATDWIADLVPHLAYGTVVAGVLNGFDRARPDE
jgi:hypothetical protein